MQEKAGFYEGDAFLGTDKHNTEKVQSGSAVLYK